MEPVADAGDGGDGKAPCSLDGAICEFYTPFKCSNGIVSAIVDPCAICGKPYWVFAHRCQQGCSTDPRQSPDADYIPYGSPLELCEENRPKKQADAGG